MLTYRAKSQRFEIFRGDEHLETRPTLNDAGDRVSTLICDGETAPLRVVHSVTEYHKQITMENIRECDFFVIKEGAEPKAMIACFVNDDDLIVFIPNTDMVSIQPWNKKLSLISQKTEACQRVVTLWGYKNFSLFRIF